MKCPVCDHNNIRDSVSLGETTVLRCENCSAEFLENYKQSRNHLYSQSYYDSWNLSEQDASTGRIKHLTFENLLNEIKKRCKNIHGENFLDIGCATGYLLDVAKANGCNVYGAELSSWAADQARERHKNVFNKTLEQCSFEDDFFDIISMTDVLEHIESPHALFNELKRIMKRGGYLLITTPDNRSWTRKFMGGKWFQFKHEHLIYYNKKALAHISKLYGFEILGVKANRKVMCMGYLHTYFKSYRVPVISEIVEHLHFILPRTLNDWPFRVPVSGEFIAILKKI